MHLLMQFGVLVFQFSIPNSSIKGNILASLNAHYFKTCFLLQGALKPWYFFVELQAQIWNKLYQIADV